jgi:hypothetical protein
VSWRGFELRVVFRSDFLAATLSYVDPLRWSVRFGFVERAFNSFCKLLKLRAFSLHDDSVKEGIALFFSMARRIGKPNDQQPLPPSLATRTNTKFRWLF